ncbi:lipid A biosynthesis acyltransferase [Xylanimonas cellulosilytica DSM 15894]|uniref:Lipid A biosynthesis acyltransferase n=1 Tax=Xylanimonas cellulosilytica (strain DSM 15894 / JCM 12276 / CECT 5975 / KCTC 9989 / LMG 20990 / NBRC 107835 / XIL07) TaxID=446471 RepID=D1BSJ0_XYLCX|nr:phosphatidylinositol mannoside acyltransferase [Xylanimonas cellulosilytica]ACZ30682.1 lipid A biosynthesis acyltransferase [Xylanimonas cellulosilytica DSM 15894]
MVDVARAYTFAWRHAAKVPEPVLRAAFTLAADIVWWRRGHGVRRLEANYARVRPELDAAAIRRLSRAGMRSYLRYFREAFTIRSITPEQVRARVRIEGMEHVRQVPDDGAAVTLALGHLGNWDLAGAWATPHLAPVLTVAEKLKPEALYDEFVAFRRSIGIEVLGLGDPGVFRELVRGAKAGRRVVPLLADRDLTASGVEVDLCGHRARVAAGPAALALAAGIDLLPTMIRYERLDGARRKAAGTPWGIVLRFYPPVPVPAATDDGTLTASDRRRAQVAAMTQGWVDAMAHALGEFTEDWHMLQTVFVEDLDPERYAKTQAEAGEL